MAGELNFPIIDEFIQRQILPSITQLMDQIAETIDVGTSEALTQLGDLTREAYASLNNPFRLQRLNDQIAQAGREQMLTAYEQQHATGRQSPPYRVGDVLRESNRRYAGGALRAALKGAEIITATQSTIEFDLGPLDEAAKQWHRLNFGAGAAAGYAARSFTVRAGDLVIGAIGLGGEPSPPFTLPPGIWIGEGGRISTRGTASLGGLQTKGDEFYPLGELEANSDTKHFGFRLRNQPIPTKGIQAWEFLDEGVSAIAEAMGPAYESYIFDVVDTARKSYASRPKSFKRSVELRLR